jgi:hypothetical protein
MSSGIGIFPEQWADMEKSTAASRAIVEKSAANETLVGYGNDLNLVHTSEGSTHDEWWSAMSLAGILNVLDQIYKSGNPTSPALASATKHWDSIYVSRYYSWHAGTWKDVYTHGSSYKLKADASDDAVDTLSKNLIVPLLEKMLADGTIHEHEVDAEAIHRGERGGPRQGQRGLAGDHESEPARRSGICLRDGLYRAQR